MKEKIKIKNEIKNSNENTVKKATLTPKNYVKNNKHIILEKVEKRSETKKNLIETERSGKNDNDSIHHILASGNTKRRNPSINNSTLDKNNEVIFIILNK